MPTRDKVCPACDEKIKADASRCKHCGTDLPLKKCPWCAETIDSDAKKCHYCKSYIEKIRCSGCGKHTEVGEMRCIQCVEAYITEQLTERWGEERFKMKVKNWTLIIIAIAAVAFGVVKNF